MLRSGRLLKAVELPRMLTVRHFCQSVQLRFPELCRGVMLQFYRSINTALRAENARYISPGSQCLLSVFLQVNLQAPDAACHAMVFHWGCMYGAGACRLPREP